MTSAKKSSSVAVTFSSCQNHLVRQEAKNGCTVQSIIFNFLKFITSIFFLIFDAIVSGIVFFFFFILFFRLLLYGNATIIICYFSTNLLNSLIISKHFLVWSF